MYTPAHVNPCYSSCNLDWSDQTGQGCQTWYLRYQISESGSKKKVWFRGPKVVPREIFP